MRFKFGPQQKVMACNRCGAVYVPREIDEHHYWYNLCPTHADPARDEHNAEQNFLERCSFYRKDLEPALVALEKARAAERQSRMMQATEQNGCNYYDGAMQSLNVFGFVHSSTPPADSTL